MLLGKINNWKIPKSIYFMLSLFSYLKWIPRVYQLTKSITRRRTLAPYWIMLWHSIKKLGWSLVAQLIYKRSGEKKRSSSLHVVFAVTIRDGRTARTVCSAWWSLKIDFLAWRRGKRKPLKGHARADGLCRIWKEPCRRPLAAKIVAAIECPAESARISIATIAKPFPPHHLSY